LRFSDFNFHNDLLEGINAIGFEQPTPIQEKAIPTIIEGKDLIGSAQTGTGKTAAFLLPIIDQILKEGADDHHIDALIVVPTRELAMQIDQQLEGLSYFTHLSSIAVIGGGDGSSFAREKQALSQGADIIIGTPGRLISHLNMSYAKLTRLTHLVLDEADRMLDMGFNDDIMRIISFLPKKRQNLLFSATMPPKIRSLARKILNEPEEINIELSKPADNISQFVFLIYEAQKLPLVKHLLKARKLQSIIVFCSTKVSTKKLNKELKSQNLNCSDIHSDLDQEARKKVLTDFKNRKLNILVATDVMSRGIDVEGIDLVINYDIPNDAEDYIHRIGRTARAETKGIAFTLVSPKEQRDLFEIETFLSKPIPKAKVPQSLGDTPAYSPKSFKNKAPHRGPTKRKYRR